MSLEPLGLEDSHRVALARELTWEAGCPLRDRYGFAASDESVLSVLRIVFREPDDGKAAESIGAGTFTGEHELAMAVETHTDEAYERAIVVALRPLVDARRDAAVRGLR